MSKVEIDGVEYECPPEVAGLLQAVSEERDELQGVMARAIPNAGWLFPRPSQQQQQGKRDRDMSNKTKPAQEAQVEIEVCKLGKRVAIVEELANTLIQRLETIARPHCPNPDCNKAEDRPQLQLVELAERLFGINRRVGAIADNLQNLLDRIEL